jgi:hypothetical protein
MSVKEPRSSSAAARGLRRRVPRLALLLLLGVGTVTGAAEPPPIARVALGASKKQGRPMTDGESCCCSICGLLFLLALYLSSKGSSMQARAKVKQQAKNASDLLPDRLESMKRKDPGFELDPFLAQAKDLFGFVQTALFRRDLGEVRPFLTDATYQRLYTQLQIWRSQGKRQVRADVKVQEQFLIGMEQNEHYDVAHVLFRFRSRLYTTDEGYTDEEVLKLASRKTPLNELTEVWSFVRYSPAPPASGDLRSAWLLSGITAGRRFMNDGEVGLPGLRELRKTDPAFTLQLLQDRAALVFWKWIEAQQQEDPGRFAMLCSPGFLEGMKKSLEEFRQQGRRLVFQDNDVPSVRGTKLRIHPDGYELADVEVIWTGRFGDVPREGTSRTLAYDEQRWELTLRRRAGATTPPIQGAYQLPCPHCGQRTDALVPVCGFCGGLIPRNEEDWVLIHATRKSD